jgi:hypothetical protein
MAQRQSKGNMHRTTVTIPNDIWDELKEYADKEHYSISLAITEILKKFFAFTLKK